MIEAIQAAAASAAQAAPGVATPQSPQANAIEVNQFADAYANGGSAQGAQATSGVAQVQGPSEGMKMFANVADRLNGGADSIKAMSEKMTSGEIDSSPSKMMELTMECHKFMFKAEVTSNVANRTSDGITQLFRQQS